jgi:predicted glycogen debranching enzyme
MSLPGLTLAAGRPQVAREILQTYARYFNNGLLPNYFPDEGGEPTYNTIDATLWYVEAVRLYFAATGDREFLRQLFPKLAEAIECYSCGSSPGVTLDRRDGLLVSEAHLTWMDAKVRDCAVTPRAGKPIEVNALWYNAIISLTEFARVLDLPHRSYLALSRQTQAGFQRFWNASTGYCYDVLDTPDGDDGRLRPNQLLAVSLPGNLLSLDRQRAVVEACGRSLLASYGLRSLSPDAPYYCGQYGGDPVRRDLVYHQGTVWGWWLGIYAIAVLRVSGDATQAEAILQPMSDHLANAGLGQISEIFDGDPPFQPRGCLAHGAAVGSLLWAWLTVARYKQTGVTV